MIKYFVSYVAQRKENKELGYGSVEITRHIPIITAEHIKGIQKDIIDSDADIGEVVILNWKRFETDEELFTKQDIINEISERMDEFERFLEGYYGVSRPMAQCPYK